MTRITGMPLTSQRELRFTRQRVHDMARLATLLSVFMFAVAVFQEWAVTGDVLWGTPGKTWHLLGTFFLGALWGVMKTPGLTAPAIAWIEGVAIVLASAAFTFLTASMSPVQASHMHGLMAATMLLLLRSIFVPSPPRNTAVIGLLQGAPLLLCTWWTASRGDPVDLAALMRSMEVRSLGELAWSLTLMTAGWWGASMLLATATTTVIHGLRMRVRKIRELGQYTLDEKIGEGGMGEVYRASHAMLRRPTAIKLLPPGCLAAEDVERFELEVQSTARLSHPHTITVYDFGRTPEGVFYYAMELLEGATLSRIVEACGPMPPGRVVHVLRQTAGALAEAHGAGMVHRDIKPANIMMARQGGMYDFAKVLDFGLVVPVGEGNRQAMGTPQYMAPEAFTRPHLVDGRSDLYSLGCVAYYLLTGRHVFQADTVDAMARLHMEEEPMAPTKSCAGDLPARLVTVVMALLEKDPSKRPQTAGCLLVALKESSLPGWSDDEAREWWNTKGKVLLGRSGAGGSQHEDEDSQKTMTIVPRLNQGARDDL